MSEPHSHKTIDSALLESLGLSAPSAAIVMDEIHGLRRHNAALLDACAFVLKYDGQKLGSIGEAMLRAAIESASKL